MLSVTYSAQTHAAGPYLAKFLENVNKDYRLTLYAIFQSHNQFQYVSIGASEVTVSQEVYNCFSNLLAGLLVDFKNLKYQSICMPFSSHC